MIQDKIKEILVNDEVETVRNSIIKNLNMLDSKVNNQLKEISQEAIK
jgi:hypothetical protein